MVAYKMAAVKVTAANDFSRGLVRSHMVVIHLFHMLCNLQRVVRDLCPNLYNRHLRGNPERVSVSHFDLKLPEQKRNSEKSFTEQKKTRFTNILFPDYQN
jgi:hypothetical protein